MIRISQLSKSFSGQVVLDHLDLEIQKGEVVALIGSSGTIWKLQIVGVLRLMGRR